MARYKVLKGVAHSIGHSFTSLMNYAGDDYVMGHILFLARLTGRDTLSVDFVKREANPKELLGEPIARVVESYTHSFWNHVQQQGSDKSLVRAASLTLRYDLTIRRPCDFGPQFDASPYVCDVRITDDRGKDYLAHFQGWWHPERFRHPKTSPRPWWKFWQRAEIG